LQEDTTATNWIIEIKPMLTNYYAIYPTDLVIQDITYSSKTLCDDTYELESKPPNEHTNLKMQGALKINKHWTLSNIIIQQNEYLSIYITRTLSTPEYTFTSVHA
jgi:hypothetical protein